MKKFLLFLLLSLQAMAQTLPITTVNNLKISAPVLGTKSDSVLVWRGGGDKVVRYVPMSVFNTLQQTLLAGNVTDQQAIFINNTPGSTSTTVTPGYVTVLDPTNHTAVLMSVGSFGASNSATGEWLLLDDHSVNWWQNAGFNKFTQNVAAISGPDKVVTWRNLSGIPALLSDMQDVYIPLGGTNSEHPVTGDLEVLEGVHIKNDNSEGHNWLFLNDSSAGIESYQTYLDYTCNFYVQASDGNVYINSNNPSSTGLRAVQDFSANNDGSDRNVYPQTGWVQDAITAAIAPPIPADFKIQNTASSLLVYKTDTYHTLDVTPLVAGLTSVTNTNEILRDGNNLFIIGNFIDNATPCFILRLTNCRILNNVLIYDSYEAASFILPRVHGSKFNRGFIYGATRADDNLLAQRVIKMNAYDFTDYKTLSLPVSGNTVGSAGDLQVYKNAVYILMGTGSGVAQYLIKMDENLNGYEVVLNYGGTSGKRVAKQSPFLIYNDEIYIPNMGRTTSVYDKAGMGVFSMTGTLKREVSGVTVNINPGTVDWPLAHWMTIFNGKVIVTSVTNNFIARWDVATLALEQSVGTPVAFTDDNVMDYTGTMYLGTDSTTGDLYYTKYNDFSTLNTSGLAYDFNGALEYYLPAQSALITNLSQLSNDVISTSVTDGDVTHSPDGNSVFDALALKESVSNKNVSGGYAGLTAWPETTYAQTIVWSGTTAPSSTLTANFRATQVGKLVTFRINAVYATPGAALSTVTVPLPTGLPIPSVITGFNTNNDYIIPCTGGMFTATGSLFPTSRAGIRMVSSGNYTIIITAGSGAYNGFMCEGTYWTD